MTHGSGESGELVSVVIATRNRSALLMRALASVAAQTWAHREVIVVDDASDDDTPLMLAARAAGDPAFRVLTNPQALGGARSRNRGIDAAVGTYIAFLDDDDEWTPHKVASQVAMLQAAPAASAASCAFTLRRPHLRPRVVRVPQAPTEQDVLSGNQMGGASMCLARRDVLHAVGAFDPDLRSAQDWDLWIRLRQAGPIVVCDEPLVEYHAHGGLRISHTPDATYSGERRVFFRYRSRMAADVRRMNLAMLLYRRGARPVTTPRAIVRHWWRVQRLTTGRGHLRFAAWSIRDGLARWLRLAGGHP